MSRVCVIRKVSRDEIEEELESDNTLVSSREFRPIDTILSVDVVSLARVALGSFRSTNQNTINVIEPLSKSKLKYADYASDNDHLKRRQNATIASLATDNCDEYYASPSKKIKSAS
jgi:predicted transcriptional regulator